MRFPRRLHPRIQGLRDAAELSARVDEALADVEVDDVEGQEVALRRAMDMPPRHPERLTAILPREQELLLADLDRNITGRRPL